MESNQCICQNYMETLKNLINSIISSAGNLGTSSPATDSGYTQINNNTNNNQQFNAGFDYLSSGFYIIMILLGVLMFMIGRPKKKSECK